MLCKILGPSRAEAGQVRHRVKVLSMAARKKSPEQFTVVAHALVNRKRIRIQHYSRQSRTTVELWCRDFTSNGLVKVQER